MKSAAVHPTPLQTVRGLVEAYRILLRLVLFQARAADDEQNPSTAVPERDAKEPLKRAERPKKAQAA